MQIPTDNDSQLPRLYDTNAVSRRWSLKPDSVRSMARRGEIPFIKFGTKMLFRETDLLAYLAAKRMGK